MSRMISRRCGSASARRTTSVPAGLAVSGGIRPPFSCLAPARGSILPLPRRSSRLVGLVPAGLSLAGVDERDQAAQEVRPAGVAHVEALELRGQTVMAEVQDRSVTRGRH